MLYTNKTQEFLKNNGRHILFALVFIILVVLGNQALRNYYNRDNADDAKSMVIDTLRVDNEVFKKQNDSLLKNNKIDEQQTILVIENKAQIKRKTVQSKEELSEVIKKINNNYKDAETMTDQVVKKDLMEQKKRDISKARISSLWDTYCEKDNPDPDCLRKTK